MLVMPRLPAVTATLWPGRSVCSNCKRAQLGVDRRGDVLQPGSLEDLANAKDLRKLGH